MQYLAKAQLSAFAGVIAISIASASAPSSAQNAVGMPQEFKREAMEQALQTRQQYDIYGILFDSDKAEIKPESSALLDDIAQAMTNFPEWNLRIIGHTDGTGDPDHNTVLSVARAGAIRDALLTRGISPGRLATAGYGEDRPIASNDTPEGRALNRRVELTRFTEFAEAKKLFKAMSDYVAGQDMIAFDYNSTFEVVTTDDQKLGLASSGSVNLDRPDRIRATRSGGFADLEVVFDAKTATLLGKNANLYTSADLPGSIDNLVDQLRVKYGRPLPAADLLMSDPYKELIGEVYDSKDLGSGVINGVECDWLAFRTNDVDWQIWIAQGAQPYPCRYTITTKQLAHAPQYTIEFRNWRTGADVAADDFAFQAPAGAKMVEPGTLAEAAGELPGNFTRGAK